LELIDEGLVKETGYGQSAGGKPPVLLRVDPLSRHIIGIDLASSEFRGAVVDLRGNILEKVVISIKDRSGEKAIEVVYQVIDKLIGTQSRPCIGIGIGVPGLLDTKAGVIKTAVNLEWEDLGLVDILEKRYKLPVLIANDSQVSAVAEHKFGGRDRTQNLLLVKVGRGVGAGIILDQQLFQGDGFGAGEIGHIRVKEDGDLCRCGNYGCLETLISSRAIRRKSKQIADEQTESLLHEIANDPKNIATAEVVEAFKMGDEWVVGLIEAVGENLGRVLAYVSSTINLHEVVIAGSVSEFGDGLIKPVSDSIQRNILPGLFEEIKVSTSSLGEDIVILGAAGMVLQNQLEIR
jgi:glucokinase-like ROK family protein